MNQVLQEENANSSTIYPLDHEDAGLQIGVLMLRGENKELKNTNSWGKIVSQTSDRLLCYLT